MRSGLAHFLTIDGGSVVAFIPHTRAAERWIKDNIPDDAPPWGAGFAAERQYAGEIRDGIDRDLAGVPVRPVR